MTHALSFFLAWLGNPRRAGAVVPSSAALADAVTAEITPTSAPIVELGPGTGVITRSLIARGIPEHRLALVEYNIRFARNVERRFPTARVFGMDASRLVEVDLFGGDRAGAVVSGLPLLLLPRKTVIAILHGAFCCLRAEGSFYQFTYGRDSPVPDGILAALGLRVTRMGRTFANFPPATIYRIQRPAGRAQTLFKQRADTMDVAFLVNSKRFNALRNAHWQAGGGRRLSQ